MSLFHYTNVHAVQSILSNKKIWLTDIRYLNDSQELHDGFSVLENFFITPYGAIKRRPGTYYVTTTKNNGVARLISFQFY